LLDEITTIFIDTLPTLADNEREVFCPLIAHLAQTLPAIERRYQAARLARAPGVPANLLRDLGPSERELVSLLRHGLMQEFASKFAQAMESPLDVADATLSDRSGRRLADACRTAGFARETYSTIVLLLDPLRLRDTNETERLLGLSGPPQQSLQPLLRAA
jgi:hypothetical protein